MADATNMAREPEAVNPSGSTLGGHNAILTGANRDYFVPDYEGCLSIKTVLSGSAVWEAAGRRFVVHENCYLVLNDRQRYTLTIDSASRVETFCVFFRRGFVEDVLRSASSPAGALLDAPAPDAPRPVDFFERLSPHGSLRAPLEGLRSQVASGERSPLALEEGFMRVADTLVREHHRARASAEAVTGSRASTRLELYRRLLRGRDFMLSSLDRRVSQTEVARAACLSPSHFHRVFTLAFGLTPHQYVTRHRLERAAHLLAGSDRSVTEVCLATGFESPGSFSTLFRRHFGSSPRDYRLDRKKAGSKK